MEDKENSSGKTGNENDNEGASTQGPITLSQQEIDQIRADARETGRQEAATTLDTEIAALRLQGEASAVLAQASAQKLHATEVRQIVAALSGRGDHEGIELSGGKAFAPAIVAHVLPLLEADFGNEPSVRLSVDGVEEEKSVTDIVLGILNAVSSAGNEAMVELGVAKGEQSHEPPGSSDDQTQEEKDAGIDEYLKRHNLALVGADSGE